MKLGDRALEDLRSWVTGPGPGEVLADRYELRRRIGEGGMGVVYAADDRVSGGRVAVKILRGGRDDEAARFEREVEALRQVEHPAIVKCIAHGVHDDSRYLVMDQLEGCSLAERLRLGRLSIRETLEIGSRIAGGLAEVHRAGIVHRDVKPSNVFLEGDDDRGSASRACLLDFGIARVRESTTLTAQGALVGTPGYMAPERVRGEVSGDCDPASDVFSLGCVLFECLLGRPPFAAETTYALLARVLLELAPLVREERPDTPAPLEALVEQMLSKEPRDRPEAAEVARVCEEIASGLPSPIGSDRVEIALGLAEGDLVAEKYRVERKLGEGGMGVVVAARHLELGTQVAIKLLRTRDADEGRFLREARAASRIESEHVARVLDVGRTTLAGKSCPFIVMEHLRGVDLARRLMDRGPLAIGLAVAYVLQACTAVAEAHALGIVHRDLKPSNLFLVERRDGRELVKVLDFGISKLTRSLDDSSSLLGPTATADSTIMGSIAYMSPEQLESSSRADERSDVWSLGVVLYELVSGSRPFEGENAVAVAARIAGSPPRPLRVIREDVPAALDQVVAKCLAKDPAQRFESVTDLVAALRAVAGADIPIARRRTIVAYAALVVLGLAGLGAYLLLRPPPPSPSPEHVPAASIVSTLSSARAVEEPPPPTKSAAVDEAPTTTTTKAPALVAPTKEPAPLPRAPAASARSSAVAPPQPAASPPRQVDLRDPALEGR